MSLIIFMIQIILSDGKECPPPIWACGATGPFDYLVETDEYSIEIGSASGAVGDVVGVSVVLSLQLKETPFPYIQLTVEHDPSIVSIVGEPVFSPEFLSLLGPGGVLFFPIDEMHPVLDDAGFGYLMIADFDNIAFHKRFPSNNPLIIMTVYYRVHGMPGESTALDFSDYKLAIGNSRCNFNKLHIWQHIWPSDCEVGKDYISLKKTSGKVEVVPGPPTHTEPPEVPPKAKVYDKLPTSIEANFQVRIEGNVATPGEIVCVDVYVSANIEFSGIMIPIQFYPEHLRLNTYEQYFWGGFVATSPPAADKNNGIILVSSGLGVNSRRLGPSDGEFLAAHLCFDALKVTNSIERTVIHPEVQIGEEVFRPYIIARYLDSNSGGQIYGEISPMRIESSIIEINKMFLATKGDSDFNDVLDITDAISILSWLFWGGRSLHCPGAADYNQDGIISITDAIMILSRLFQGTSPIEPFKVQCKLP